VARRKIRYYSPKRRAIYAQGEKIVALEIFKRDNWICGICKDPINPRLRCPNWWAATLDHIVPLCRGGSHTADNVTAAHLICNLRKGDGDIMPKAI
jgi:5-methylcytosine-specific restriction endonuclease McrA